MADLKEVEAQVRPPTIQPVGWVICAHKADESSDDSEAVKTKTHTQ